MLQIKPESLDWALMHALSEGDTDIFPPAFEFQAIQHDWDRLREWLAGEDILSWMTRPLRRCLSPKHRFGFRVATQLDPIDFLIFTALVYEIGDDLEKRRLPISEQTVYSCRFAPTSEGSFYDDESGYGSFQHQCREYIESGMYSHVVVADIADFYPQLYAHRVENALRSATNKTNHAIALKKLLAQWNEHISYGIPVGPAASRLIAETAVDDVDKVLCSEGATFVRFIDDYRIFCKSNREAYQQLASLANSLFENHGLTLQQNKTTIITVDQFAKNYLATGREKELTALAEKFRAIVETLDLDNPYEDIEYDDLESSLQEQIDSLNLVDMLTEQFALEDIDITLVKFLLRRLGQLNNPDCIDDVLDNIDKLYPVFTSAIGYLRRLRIVYPSRQVVGERVLGLLDTSIVSHLEFHRLWLLDLFTHNMEWDNQSGFAQLFGKFSDGFSQRKLMLALGQANQDHWFRTRKRNVYDYGHWSRRAFLAAGSCLPSDERRHWFDSLQPRLDPLEQAITRWARSNPFPQSR